MTGKDSQSYNMRFQTIPGEYPSRNNVMLQGVRGELGDYSLIGKKMENHRLTYHPRYMRED